VAREVIGMGERKSAVEASQYQAAGKVVVCPHCENDTFTREEAMLNKPVSTLLKLDWVDKTGVALVCANCGLIQWFFEEPERVA
jgi:predicted nucleic-acid-binding Zn-ribbon protein